MVKICYSSGLLFSCFSINHFLAIIKWLWRLIWNTLSTTTLFKTLAIQLGHSTSLNTKKTQDLAIHWIILSITNLAFLPGNSYWTILYNHKSWHFTWRFLWQFYNQSIFWQLPGDSIGLFSTRSNFNYFWVCETQQANQFATLQTTIPKSDLRDPTNWSFEPDIISASILATHKWNPNRITQKTTPHNHVWG